MTKIHPAPFAAPERSVADRSGEPAGRLALVDREREYGTTRAAVRVRVYASDPISEFGIAACLRHHGEVRLVAAGQPATVAVAVADGLDEERLRWLRALRHDGGVSVVLVTGNVDPRMLVAAVEAGICAVISRSEVTPEKLVHAVLAASRGDAELPPRLLRHLLDQVRRLNRHADASAFAGLADRERDVLRLAAEGLSTREIADSLNYSERTIKTVLQDLTIRLHLRNRTHAVAYALRKGWI